MGWIPRAHLPAGRHKSGTGALGSLQLALHREGSNELHPVGVVSAFTTEDRKPYELVKALGGIIAA